MPIIWAAKIPAFLAPSNATVATGTPPGICKIDKIESHPSIEFLDLTGTPITGKGDSEAIIPGKFRKRVWLREGTKVLLNSGYEVIQVIRDSDSVANDAAKAISKVTKDSNGGIVCFQNFSDDEEEDDLIINNLTINRQKVSHKGLDRKFTDPDELAATIVKESNEEIDGEIDFDDI